MGGTLDEMNKTIGNISERLVSEKLQWSSTEDGPSYQENVRSSSRSDLMLSLGDGMKKKKGKRKSSAKTNTSRQKIQEKVHALTVVTFACFSCLFLVKCVENIIRFLYYIIVVASSDMAERMLRKELEQEIYNENYIRKMYRRRWSRNAHQDRVNSGEQLGLRLSLIHE